MRTSDNLFEKIVSFANLIKAAKKAQLNKRLKESTARFNLNLENEIINLREELISGEYTPGRYNSFYIYEPKKRLISAAPYRDRVVHHAVCNIIEPIFEKSFIYDSYANRKNKGTHKAIIRFQKMLVKNKYILKCDVKKYFPSIDHKILKEVISRKIKCIPTLNLLSKIIDHSNEQEYVVEYFPGDDLFTPFERRRGLPIGNLTSQFFANIYLNPLDHYIKEKLYCKNYVRYVDDFVIADNCKIRLREIKKAIEDYLAKFRLTLNKNKSIIYSSKNGIEFLGHKVFPGYRLLKKSNIYRFIRRFNQLKILWGVGAISGEEFVKRVKSWSSHASFSCTYSLRSNLFGADFKII